ncbi:MAG: DUF3298 domain-containing protein [Pedobacter sp.]|nr:MAG: DUF3298 domain-containing protein [Pedobacter sp.]
MFTSFSNSDSTAAFPNRKGSPQATFSLNFPDPKDQWLKAEFGKVLQFNDPNWGAAIKKVSQDYFKEYRSVSKDEAYYDATEGGGFLSYTKNTFGYIKYNEKGFVVIDQFRDDYTGGAHGYYFSTMHCFDVKEKRKLKLDDIVTLDSVALQPIVERFFREQYDLKPGEGLSKVLFDSHLPASANFYFNSNGLSFIYNPYEVASYAQGQLMVFLPFKDIKQHLTPSFRKRMGMDQ